MQYKITTLNVLSYNVYYFATHPHDVGKERRSCPGACKSFLPCPSALATQPQPIPTTPLVLLPLQLHHRGRADLPIATSSSFLLCFRSLFCFFVKRIFIQSAVPLKLFLENRHAVDARKVVPSAADGKLEEFRLAVHLVVAAQSSKYQVQVESNV